MQDLIPTDIFYLLPCAIKWFYHRKIKKDISVLHLKDRFGKKAYLYQHGKFKSDKNDCTAILILHGMHSHPFVMRHLAEMANKTNLGPVFSFYVVYDDINNDSHRSVLKLAIDNIEKISLDHEKSLNGIIMVGHSMGAIEAAYTAFVEKDKRILSVISIAGRLKVVESVHSPCKETLKDSVNRIYIESQLNPKISLYQIVGRRDWNAPLESTIIRNDKNVYHIVENAMHFNILFHKDMREFLPKFIKNSFQSN